MKFKIGDRVRVKKDLKYNNFYGGVRVNEEMVNNKGKILTIIGIDNGAYLVEGSQWFWADEMFEKKEYTYEDLKKSPIGTKITLEKIQDKQLVKTAPNRIENDDYRFFIGDFEGLNTSNYGRIIKIEEPKYRTVYEAKVEILDDVEKRYLRGVIRPFRDKVQYVKKFTYGRTNSIDIQIENKKRSWLIELPPFKKDTMYKNMEDNKKYTLEELGL